MACRECNEAVPLKSPKCLVTVPSKGGSGMAKGKWILPILIMSLAACATAPVATVASSESDTSAKKFMPPEGKANLYIAWSNNPNGGARSFNVSLDGKMLGVISPGTYNNVAIDPGKHSIVVTSNLNSAKVSLDAAAGKNYFYEVTASAGTYTAQPSISLVLLEEMGKIMVRQNKRAQTISE